MLRVVAVRKVAMSALIAGLLIPFVADADHSTYDPDGSFYRDWDYRLTTEEFFAGTGDGNVYLDRTLAGKNFGGVEFHLDGIERAFRLTAYNTLVVPDTGPTKVGFRYFITDEDANVLANGHGCLRIWPTGDTYLPVPDGATHLTVYVDEVIGPENCTPFSPAPGTALHGYVDAEFIVDRVCTRSEWHSYEAAPVPPHGNPCVWIWEDGGLVLSET